MSYEKQIVELLSMMLTQMSMLMIVAWYVYFSRQSVFEREQVRIGLKLIRFGVELKLDYLFI